MSLFPSMESINYQYTSKLGEALTEVFQDVIDFKNNLDYSKCRNDVHSQREYRLNEVNEYVKKTMIPKFIKTVKDEIGLVVTKVYTYGGSNQDIYGMFAVNLSMDNVRDAMETIGRSMGTDNYTYESSRESVAQMATMSKNLDLKTGKLTSSTYAKKRKIFCQMHFDVNFAFCLDDFISVGITENLTAKELAATMMHECGHVISMVEHASDMFVVKNRVDNILQASKQWDPIVAIKDMKELLIPALKKKATQSLGDPNTENVIRKYCLTLINSINALSEAVGTEPDEESWIVTIGSLIFNPLYIFLKVILLLFFYITIIVPVLTYLFVEISKHVAVDETSEGTKSSDLMTTRNNLFMQEMLADDMVAKHGMGQYLASGLNKFNTVFDNYKLDYISSHRIRKSAIFSYIVQITCFILEWINVFNYVDTTIYENQYKRNVRIRENTYKFFKNPKIPGSIRDIWIKNIEELDKAIKESKKVSDTEIGQSIMNVVMNLTNPVKWFMYLKNNHLERDMARLQNNIDSISSNRLWYLSHKLAQ